MLDIYHYFVIVCLFVTWGVLVMLMFYTPNLDQLCSTIQPQTKLTQRVPLIWYGHWMTAMVLSCVATTMVIAHWDAPSPIDQGLMPLTVLAIGYVLLLCFQDFLEFVKKGLRIRD